MRRLFNMNMARAFIGKTVNVCLQDGSVILNVKVVAAENQMVKCKANGQRKPLRFLLKEVAWLEQLNPHFVEKMTICCKEGGE